MKKLLSLLLCLALFAVPALSLAEAAEAVEIETYTEENGAYSFNYPSNWTLLSRDSINEVFDAAATMDDDQLKSMVEQARASIEQYGIVMLLAPDYSTNINLVVQTVGTSVAASDLLAMSEQFISQLSGTLQGFQVTGEAAVAAYGDNEYMRFGYEYEVMDRKLSGVQFYACPKTDLAVITYTVSPDEAATYEADLETILASLSF